MSQSFRVANPGEPDLPLERQWRAYNDLKTRRICSTRFMADDVLHKMGVTVDLKWMINRLSLRTLWNARPCTIEQLTLELLSSIKLVEDDDTGAKNVEFRLANQAWSLSLPDFNSRFGFSPNGRTENLTTDEESAFWFRLTREPIFAPSKAEITQVLHPAIRMMHCFIVNTIFAREHSQGAVENRELLLLWCIFNNQPVNIGHLLAQKMIDLQGEQGGILIGGLVTILAQSLGINLHHYESMPNTSTVDLSYLKNAQLIRMERMGPRRIFLHSSGAGRDFPLPLGPTFTVRHEHNWYDSLINYGKLPVVPSADAVHFGASMSVPPDTSDDQDDNSDRHYLQGRVDRLVADLDFRIAMVIDIYRHQLNRDPPPETGDSDWSNLQEGVDRLEARMDYLNSLMTDIYRQVLDRDPPPDIGDDDRRYIQGRVDRLEARFRYQGSLLPVIYGHLIGRDPHEACEAHDARDARRARKARGARKARDPPLPPS